MQLYQYGLARDNRIVSVDSSAFKIEYGISTLPGQSGSPVVVGSRIIAIHNGGGKKL
jgi:V8-like Glu-specific endopeptidase